MDKYEQQLQLLRQEWMTATPSRKFSIELQARALKSAIRIRDIKRQNMKPIL